ncbi:9802_t:CDS:2 [Racocetra fulgida]|uniref:9802_t:CDS:1 n=1 Tax=Racocetra fulgida TaxID=60492 RepID=A0A9N9AF37_9GLOM|nr:9802_t:CDS:2 [Racocetra fulgida]
MTLLQAPLSIPLESTLKIFDTSGQERFRTITTSKYLAYLIIFAKRSL